MCNMKSGRSALLMKESVSTAIYPLSCFPVRGGCLEITAACLSPCVRVQPFSKRTLLSSFVCISRASLLLSPSRYSRSTVRLVSKSRRNSTCISTYVIEFIQVQEPGTIFHADGATLVHLLGRGSAQAAERSDRNHLSER